ncbi:MAG TPA: hypothetical protein V6D17_15490 [Candidatus Obscuribacterales bacterium]
MIELQHNELVISFPEVHADAKLHIGFQRTLRIPDDDRVYPLPPGLGNFPLVHVDDYSDKVPADWLDHGGIILPMYQAEAMWIHFRPTFSHTRHVAYPFAIKVSTGKIDAITGSSHSNGLHKNPQDYLIVPNQPWLDGYCVKKGVIRQFVAMPLGEGFTAEEQITKKAEHGGIQLVVYPMKPDEYERRFPVVPPRQEVWGSRGSFGALPSGAGWGGAAPPASMGLSPGGRMHQEIYEDTFGLNSWDLDSKSRCFVHIANSLVWHSITGTLPPHMPPSASDYSNAGLPWFDYYSDDKALKGSAKLGNLKSVQAMSGWGPSAKVANESCYPMHVVQLRKGLKPGQVREGDF